MLTKKIFLPLGIILAIIACTNTLTAPDNVIDEQTMSKILADIHLIEAKSSRLSFQAYDSTKVAYNELERRVMVKYKTDTTRYKASYKFYVTNPESMIRIYDETLKILKDMEEKRKKLRK
ncbi:DUF4296 domain-containing protein [Emticicia sp.]|uniref:DUF4296 domain-containing protein n=1 Tax=Emticicia sp. TaxID=1930953 RepID=UPI003752E630